MLPDPPGFWRGVEPASAWWGAPGETSPLPRVSPWLPGCVVLVVDAAVGAAAVGAATADVGRVLGVVVVEAWSGAVAVPSVVVVVTAGGIEVGVVVVTAEDGGWDGATSVVALQICAYVAGVAGGGPLGLSGSSLWNLQPSTSSAGLATDCSAGPLLA